MNPRKICVYIEQYGIGGVDTHLYSLLNQWPESKDEIYIITNRGNRGLELVRKNLERACQVDVFDIPTVISLRKHHKWKILGRTFGRLAPLLFIYQIYCLYKIFKTYHFDVVLCDNGSYPGGATCQAAIIAAYLLKIKKRFLLVHHWAIPRRKMFYLVEWFNDQLVLALATKVIAVSKATKNTLVKQRGFEPEKIKVVYNGIEIKNHSDDPGSIELRRMCGISEATYLIGVFGNIESPKGHDVLIQALPLINDNATLHLCIIGSIEDQEYYDHLISLIADFKLKPQVTFSGFIAGSPFNILKQIDLLIMPTKDFEAFGYVLAEAMVVGTPVIASKVGAIPEIINNEESGILFEPLDSKELAKAIARVKGDKQLRDRMIKNAKERMLTKFTARRMADEFCALTYE